MLNEMPTALQGAAEEQVVDKYGQELLRDPLLNKGLAFTAEERKAFGLTGVLPPACIDLETQVQRVLESYNSLPDPMSRFLYLADLQDQNETLFYRVLVDNLVSMTPVVYTPTVGTACQRFSRLFRRPRGLYLSAADRGRFAEILARHPAPAMDIIVVTDGSRILGLGDLGAGGMGISVGKIALYVAGGGIAPDRSLPVMLDVGTGNRELLEDPCYLGLRQPRLTGDSYDSLVEEFVSAAHQRWPMALIQFEDFTNDHAFPLLARYRDTVLCFNDDIQGTGAVALAGLLGALRVTGTALCEQRVVFYGAGSAAIGIADMIVAGMMEERRGSAAAARQRFWLLDSKGLVTRHRHVPLAAHKVPYARDEASVEGLLEVIRAVKPTVLMGLSGQPGAFTEDVVREMARHVPRPIIFSLSNPTSKAECTAEQAYRWTGGKAIFASGSPFDPVQLNGQRLVPGQGNNMFIFPGVGLGATVCGAATVTDAMFYAAAKTLAESVSEAELATGTVYPDLHRIRGISRHIAAAVCRVAEEAGVAGHTLGGDAEAVIQARMYEPQYRRYITRDG